MALSIIVQPGTSVASADNIKIVSFKKTIMKKSIYLSTIYLLMSFTMGAQNVLYVSPGATFKPRNGALVTIKDMNYDNNGASSIASGDGTVRFSGNSNDTIMGTASTSFDVLEVDKPGTGRLFLDRLVNISTSVEFIAGQLHLNNNRLLLSPSALLLNEREGSRIVGPTGGTVEIVVAMNAPNAVNPGNLGAIITSTNNMGFCSVRRGHVSQTNGSGNGSSINRYYDIFPQNNTALDATLQFKYFDSELNGFNESVVTLWRSADLINWSDQGFTSRDISLNYVEKTNIPSFSRWTLSTPGNPLPIHFSAFNLTCQQSKVLLNWKTSFEQNTVYFEIQRSSDGSNWASIGHLPASGNSTTEKSYNYIDTHPLAGNAYYRIMEYGTGGNSRFTQILKSDCEQKEQFKVWPNPVTDKLFISITCTANVQGIINVYDSKGALVKQQQDKLSIGNNQLIINMKNLSKGNYTIVLSWNNEQQQMVKIIKL